MITLTNFKRKYEKLGFADNNKEEIEALRSKSKTSWYAKQRLRKLTGGNSYTTTEMPKTKGVRNRYRAKVLSARENRLGIKLKDLNIDDYNAKDTKKAFNTISSKVTTHKGKINKPKLSNKAKLGIAAGVLATGAGIVAIRKTRKDKGIKRGNYKK